MDSNLIFKLSDSTITISQMKKDVREEDLNNTNIIDVKDLKFSILYIKENFELVASFLNVAIIKKNITIAKINNLEHGELILDLINTWEHINKIIFKQDKKINFNIFLKLLDNNYVKEIECYDMPQFLIDRLDLNKKLKIITRCLIPSNSLFMKENFLNSYSDIYYKRMVVISSKYDENDIMDFISFININSRLKIIRIINFSNELLTTIIKELQNTKKKNVRIEIEEKNNDLDTIYNTVTYLKKVYKKDFEKNNITFKLNYSDSYKFNNFFKQINFKLFTTIILLIILVTTLAVGINYYKQFLDQESIDSQMVKINEILNNAEEISTTKTTTTTVKLENSTTTKTTTTRKVEPIYYTNFSKVFEELLKINKDTVGWITVNNTNINYPVVQSDSNKYYLSHDFYQKKNSMGWIFMDYRNSISELDQNTIIYGHNVKEGIMFGTFWKMLNSSWYNKSKNQIVTFNTLNTNMKWQLFSVYKVETTEDYLRTNFDTSEEFLEFINLIKSRSVKDFNVEINENSKILTLSTCSGKDKRNVAHAVLIEN